MHRAIEIQKFLAEKRTKYNILRYAIVDDGDVLKECGNDNTLKSVIDGHFVLIDGSTGITEQDVQTVIQLLQL